MRLFIDFRLKYILTLSKLVFLNFIDLKVLANLFIIIFILFSHHAMYSQSKLNTSIKKDTLLNTKDSTKGRMDSFKLKVASEDIKSRIQYKAKDSIVYDMRTKKMYLYNESNVDYTDIHIDAFFIDYDWTTSTLGAKQNALREDSIVGKPYMKQGGKDYFTEKMYYNFKSKRGKVYNIVTQEDEALLHGEEVKKDSAGNWYIGNAKYTTCNLEHPHFYFNGKKMKLTNKKSIVTGPTNIVIQEVKTPIYLPFGIFPSQQGRRSGIILPKEYGFNPEFNLRGMGFYVGINDHLDATFLSDLYFNGSYNFNGLVRYNTIYKYDGSFEARLQRTFTGDPDNPAVSDGVKPEYGFTWIHNQSQKAHPTFRFSSKLSYSTAGLYSNSLIIDPTLRTNGQISSNLNITKTFRNSPIIFTGGLGYTQNLAAKSISGNLPTAGVRYNGNPFKLRRNTNSFVNNINLQYSTEFTANLPISPDSILFTNQFLNTLQYGVNNLASFNFGGLKLLKYLNVVPLINYNDRFYFKKRTLTYQNAKLDTADETGFYSVRDFSGGLNLNTVLSGYYLFGKKSGFKGFKHTIIPSVGISFAPDFKSDFWGYYDRYNRNDTFVEYYKYVGVYGAPGNSQTAMLNFGINNSIEGKFQNKRDTVNGTQKRMLLDVFSLGGSYNLVADSFKLSNIGASFSNSTLGFLGFSGSMNFDPYVYDSTMRKDRLKISEGQGLAKMTNLNASINLSLRSTDFSKNALTTKEGEEVQRQYIYRNYHHFYDFNSPWNLLLSINGNLDNSFSSLTRRDTTTYGLSILMNNLDFNVTKHWKIAISSGYDFKSDQIGMTTIKAIRDMHCWEFSISYTPISNLGGQGYLLEIRPKARLLQDLKLSRNKPIIDSYF